LSASRNPSEMLPPFSNPPLFPLVLTRKRLTSAVKRLEICSILAASPLEEHYGFDREVTRAIH
jgi:hypothetical protein